ncbi:MAG TPA: hypothetical protein VK590_07470 [Saprospiraceae bacterium]|nr:hypothetical protein [Saprospiraceae bacterium]
MGQKTYNKFVSDTSAEVSPTEQSNDEPFKPWTGFDSFFHEYCRKHDVNPKWKTMVKDHIKKLGLIEDQTKWEEGCKHFGI